jgi:ankyrin repeat protein
MEAVLLGDGSSKYVTIVELLVAAGCNRSIPDKNGVTALEHARKMGYKEIVRILDR